MKVEVEVTEYLPEQGMRTDWEDDHCIKVTTPDRLVVIEANRAGLLSLARHILTLAQESVPVGNHWHLDDSNSLEDGSTELIIMKV